MKKYDFESFLCVRKEYGNEIQALCPFHQDRNPSFTANIKSGMWICHAGCGQGHYVTFLKSIKNGACTTESARRLPSKIQRPTELGDLSLFHKVDEYIYIDLSGVPRLRITRHETNTGEKTFRQEHLNKKGYWVPGGIGNQMLWPFMYEDWFTSNEPFLFIVEGEKCVRLLRGMRFAATTFIGGANGWRPHYAEYFEGRNVIILPDNDAPGKKFAGEVLAGLQKITRTRIIELPGLGVGEDVFDWFKKGGTLNDFRSLLEG
jgi:putative DNA primase/helicase